MKTIDFIYAFACILCLSGCDGGLESEAKKAVQDKLTDPQSAQFREVMTFRGDTVCGEVNAKNQFGGYAGYRLFVYFKSDPTDKVKFNPPQEVALRLCNPLSFAEQEKESAKLEAQQKKELAKLELPLAKSKCEKALSSEAEYTKLLEVPATDTTENRRIRNNFAEEAKYLCEQVKVLMKDAAER